MARKVFDGAQPFHARSKTSRCANAQRDVLCFDSTLPVAAAFATVTGDQQRVKRLLVY